MSADRPAAQPDGCYRVDYQKEEAEKLIAGADLRLCTEWHGRAVEINIRGEWMLFCRTDLKDDVCTGTIVADSLTDADVIAHAVANYRPRYGARVTRHSRHGRANFAAIDAFSDG